MENMETQSFLSFKLGKELFASNVNKVLNILEMTKYTKVPKAITHMKGVINLRGEVLPLIDARQKMYIIGGTDINKSCILVLDVDLEGESTHIGAIVDSVQDVFEVNPNQILPPPTVGNSLQYNFLDGVIEKEGSFVMLLNMDRLFSINEHSVVNKFD